MPGFERRDLMILVVGLVILSLFGWFVCLRVTAPFDGARLPPGIPAWRPGGVLIQPVHEDAGGPRSGDLVVAVIIFVKSQIRNVARAYYLTAVSVLGSTTWAFGLQVSDLANCEIFWLFYLTTTVAYLLIWLATLHFGLIFPQRHPLNRRYGWTLPAIYIFPYLIHAVYILALRAGSNSALAWFSQSETDIGWI